MERSEDEQKRMNATLVQMSAASFAIGTSPIKVIYPWTRKYNSLTLYVCIRENFAFNLQYLFVKDVHRKPTKLAITVSKTCKQLHSV